MLFFFSFCVFFRESRYLLILTENYAALTILQQQFLEGKGHDPVVIFGSSFPKDQHYTQVRLRSLVRNFFPFLR